MVASETASSWGPQLNAQPPPPIAQAPNPVFVIRTRLKPRGRCGRFMTRSSGGRQHLRSWQGARHVSPAALIHECNIVALTIIKFVDAKGRWGRIDAAGG